MGVAPKHIPIQEKKCPKCGTIHYMNFLNCGFMVPYTGNSKVIYKYCKDCCQDKCNKTVQFRYRTTVETSREKAFKKIAQKIKDVSDRMLAV